MEGKDEGLTPDRFFRFSENGNAPWEIARPQSVIIKLVEKNIFSGEVLDIGCGIADNAIYIVQHANNINYTGIDLVN
jgi:SAM-dependent methyltransferase